MGKGNEPDWLALHQSAVAARDALEVVANAALPKAKAKSTPASPKAKGGTRAKAKAASRVGTTRVSCKQHAKAKARQGARAGNGYF